MKITCPYCDSLFNDTMEHCPNCGAVNSGVVRRSGSQPTTIAELEAWYHAKGLPPYETTRFFIGEDYRKPRAFGIYQDEKSGNFVVYKNKDSGQRAIRYEGTDEAYAVNELFQRLKQEIIQQKRANLSRQNLSNTSSARQKKLPLGCLVTLITLSLPFVIFLFAIVLVLLEDIPADGYYRYNQTLYYHYDHSEPVDHTDWFCYDGQDWDGPIPAAELPDSLKKNTQAQTYFLSTQTPADMEAHSFTASDAYQDASRNYTVDTGYYQYYDRTYYHISTTGDAGWYCFDPLENDWYETPDGDVPHELQRHSSAEDFYFTPVWDGSTQITDFTDTAIYENYIQQQEQSKSDWNDNDWDDDDYNWDSDDDWDSDDSDWDSDW